MTVQCAQCGQQNNPQYRFCGMCGAPLGPPPPPVRNDAERERARTPVSGPSFLGLGDERSRDLDYLLEDEPRRGHGRLYFALLLLVVSGALLAWHWQRDGYPWAGMVPRPSVGSHPSTPSATPSDSVAAAPGVPAEPTANPAPPESQSVPAAGTQASATDPAASGGSEVNLPAAGKPPDQRRHRRVLPLPLKRRRNLRVRRLRRRACPELQKQGLREVGLRETGMRRPGPRRAGAQTAPRNPPPKALLR